MSAIVIVLLIFAWLAIPFGMGMYARKNGLTFWSIFLISVFFTPLIGAIVFAVDINHKRKEDEARKQRKLQAKSAAKWACIKCGTLNNGKFCSACATPRPTVETKRGNIIETEVDRPSQTE